MNQPRAVALRAGALAGGLLLVASAGWTAETYYFGHSVSQGGGMDYLLPEELAQHALYRAFALPALALLGFALVPLVARGLPLLRRCARAGWWLPALACTWIAAVGLEIGQGVLGGSPVTDDEQVLSFMGEVLRQGAVLAPPPPGPVTDWPFFKEQFVAVTERGRFGQYSLGHPLVLALGQALRLEALVVPLISGLLAFGVFGLGRATFGPRTAALAVLLLALSPQVLLTAGTRLSQPTSALLIVLATWAVAIGDRTRGPRVGLLVAAGLLLGGAILVRPLPGTLVMVAAVVWLAWPRRSWSSRSRLIAACGLGFAAALGLLAVLATNAAQSGHPLVSAYQAARPHLAPGSGGFSRIAGGHHGLEMRIFSLVGGLLRADLWFLGWPAALALPFLARRRRGAALLGVLVLAIVVYRLVVPKQGVSPTGPVYLYEALPLLCVLAASGILRAWGARAARPIVPAIALAGAFVAAVLFVPTKLRDLRLQGEAFALPGKVLSRIPGRLAVFHQRITPEGSSWAYFPRPNPVGYDARVLYLRLLRTPEGSLEPNLDFARRQFPDRLALFVGWEGERLIVERLDAHVARLHAATP